MMKYLRIPVPDWTLNGNGIIGRVIVQCVIEKDGKVTNSKVVRSVDPYLDKAALKLVKKMPQWIPGEQDSNKVRVRMTLPVKPVPESWLEHKNEKKDNKEVPQK